MILRKDKSENGRFILKSKLLDMEVPLHVIFPANHAAYASTTPVLYLLHGLFGRFDNWFTNTNIVEYAKKYPFAIVCAEGGNGWYADSPHLENHFYASYFLNELIPNIESEFNIGQRREKRAIAGLSMGGYGAFKFAFRQPEKFCFAASMSGAFHAAEIRRDDKWTELHDSILAVFADEDSFRSESDLFQIIENYSAETISALPYFYFDCGTEDGFLPVNVRLSKVLQQRGIAHEFQIFSGGHDWDYWNAQLENVLRMTASVFHDKFRNS